MEALFRLLPGPQPVWIRYGATMLMVLFGFALHLRAEDRVGEYAFLLYILPITAAALLFDHDTGIFAIVPSVALISGGLDWEANWRVHIAAMAMFILVSLCLVFIAEGLHRAL